ncbi:MAG: LysM peptidoglycan-binding domain-containing protein [Treponema sp.]|jgi:membrane-bound lytic murein transglycosylase D|nr:LysM peptidoglycan-binding domain-containing protein [Treponema sp.]
MYPNKEGIKSIFPLLVLFLGALSMAGAEPAATEFPEPVPPEAALPESAAVFNAVSNAVFNAVSPPILSPEPLAAAGSVPPEAASPEAASPEAVSPEAASPGAVSPKAALPARTPEYPEQNVPLPPRPLRKNPYQRPPRLLPHGAAEDFPPPSGAIRGLDAALTRHYINQYSTPGGIAWLEAILNRAGPYMAFIRKELEARNLPAELIYLPVIESGYLATATSKSGAAGLWQFMKNSIAPFDMRVSDWADERMDFWKSTVGALRKLEENYTYFEDWPLALAAYNAGMGAMRTLVRQTGIKDYWVLSEKKLLKTETQHYVPKLLAVAYITSRPRRFGLSASWPEDPEWTRIRLGRTVDLDLLAKEAGINGEELKRANRELAYNVTPPDPSYHLKVPGRYAAAVQEVLERKDLTLIKYYFHTIRSGDTLSVLARHYGVSVEQITGANPGVRAQYLQIGARLIIPAIKEVEPYRKAETASPVFEGNYLVKRGETLWSIALAYNVDPEILAEANGMGLNDTLREGRSLKTPIR